MTSSKRTAILLISCPDQPGIVSAVSSFIGNHNGNIVYLDQHVDSRAGLFFMRIEWETENLALGDGRVSGRALRNIQETSRVDFVQNLNPVFLCCYFWNS